MMQTTTNGDGDLPKIRMMVLETDTPHPDTESEKGSFGEILHRHFEMAGKEHDPPLGIETDQRFVVTDKGGKVPRLEDFADIHCLLITGSMYDAHGNDPWILDLLSLLKEIYLYRPDIKLSGVCFGHQLINRLLGAEIKPAPSGDWELGHSRINLSDVGKKIFRTDDDKVYLHQMHQDQVVSPPTSASSGGLLPKGTKVHIWGHSPHTEIQGIFVANRALTTQAHLAFDEDMVHRQIQMRIDSGGIQDLDHADRGKETAHLDHDGDVVAAAILRFFHDEDKDIDGEVG